MMATTLPFLVSPLVLLRSRISSLMAEAGPVMGSSSPELLNSNVRLIHFHHPQDRRPKYRTLVVYRTVNLGAEACCDLTTDSMIDWVGDFSNTYNSLAGPYPVILTASRWWKN